MEKILARYAELGKDPEVSRALADLSVGTRLKHKLGPSKDLRDAARWVERARGGTTRDPRVGMRRK